MSSTAHSTAIPSTMKAVRKMLAGPGFELVEMPVPVPEPNEVLIKVLACSLCGTDGHVCNWDPPFCHGRLTPPITTGHELCGEIVSLGSSVNSGSDGAKFQFAVGDLVSAESHLPCQSQPSRAGQPPCEMCRTGNGHICAHVKFFSVDRDGFLAEYATAPANILWKNDANTFNGIQMGNEGKSVDWALLALQESLGNSVYTVEAANVQDKSVAVFGTGPTGLNAIAVAKAMGAKLVVAVAGTERHAELARAMGADVVLNRHQVDVVEEIKKLSDGAGVHVGLEMSGNGNALEQCLDSVRCTGIVSILGLYSKPLTLDWSKKIVLKDLTVRGIYGRLIWKTWETTAKLLREGLNVRPVITHEFEGIERFNEGFQLMEKSLSGKVVFYPHGKPKANN